MSHEFEGLNWGFISAAITGRNSVELMEHYKDTMCATLISVYSLSKL